jgi:hypothetical protein
MHPEERPAWCAPRGAGGEGLIQGIVSRKARDVSSCAPGASSRYLARCSRLRLAPKTNSSLSAQCAGVLSRAMAPVSAMCTLRSRLLSPSQRSDRGSGSPCWTPLRNTTGRSERRRSNGRAFGTRVSSRRLTPCTSNADILREADQIDRPLSETLAHSPPLWQLPCVGPASAGRLRRT